MATTTFAEDHLGRNLVDPSGTAKDFLGRLTTSTADFLGRGLTVNEWADATAYAVGDTVHLSGGEELRVTEAGTSDATPPAAPGSVGGTVEDGTVTWERTE